MSIKAIREDIKGLQGAEVKIFGQPTTLSSDVGDGLIDILDVLNLLEEHEKDLKTEVYNVELDSYDELEFDSVQEYVDYMEDELMCWKEVSHGNSYNWSAPVSHDFDYKIFQDLDAGRFFVQLMVHRFGDVRANYTEYALLEFDYEEDFIYTVMEANTQVDLDDKHYAMIDVLSHGYEVYTHDGEYVDVIHDLEEWEEKKVAEG